MWQRWSEAERAVINQFLDDCQNTPPFGYTRDLAPLLPGRSLQDVRNGVNMIRRRRLRICGCGTPLEEGALRCPTCVQKQHDTRAQRLAHGCCATCGDTLNTPGASATLCLKCRTRRQTYRPADLARFKAAVPKKRAASDPLASHKIIRWPACGHARWIAQLAASMTPRPIIDLFGGTGELLRLTSVYGGQVHAYYDLDHRIVALVQHAVYPDPANTLPQDTLDLIMERAPRDYNRRARLLGQTLQPHQPTIACMDAIHVLGNNNHPHNAIFIADPPWPGTEHPCLHTTIDHARLLDALLDLPYGQDFILSLGSERQALNLAAKHLGQAANFFWRTSGPYNAKSILALSPRLAKAAKIPNRINPAAYGCLG